MPSFSSQAGHLAFMTQPAADTFAPTFSTAAVVMRHRSGSLAPNRELLIPDPEIGGNRDVPDAYLGAVSWAGDIEFYARFEAMATLLRAAFGSAATTGAAGTGHTHVFTPTETALPWLSMQEKVGNTFDVFNYIDCKVNTLHFEADANGYLMGTAGIIARKQIAGSTVIPSVATKTDATSMVVGTNISVTYNGVTLPAKSFSFDLNNNMEDDDFRLGSFYMGDMTEKRREVTMGFSIRPQDSALWRQALYGAPAATVPGGLVGKQPAVVTMTAYEDIPGTTPSVKYSLAINVPTAAIQPYAVEPSGDDVIESDLELQALRPNPANPIVTATLVNGKATIV
jgi:hypothetical protein